MQVIVLFAPDRLPDGTYEMNYDDRTMLECVFSWRRGRGAPASVSLLAVGPPEIKPVVRRALALGADRGLLFHEDLALGDVQRQARCLCRIIESMGPFQILCAGGVSPWSQTFQMTAELLGLPAVTQALEFQELNGFEEKGGKSGCQDGQETGGEDGQETGEEGWKTQKEKGILEVIREGEREREIIRVSYPCFLMNTWKKAQPERLTFAAIQEAMEKEIATADCSGSEETPGGAGMESAAGEGLLDGPESAGSADGAKSAGPAESAKVADITVWTAEPVKSGRKGMIKRLGDDEDVFYHEILKQLISVIYGG